MIALTGATKTELTYFDDTDEERSEEELFPVELTDFEVVVESSEVDFDDV